MRDPNRALREPIYQSATFYFESVEQLEEIMREGARFPKDKTGKYVYTRGSNPNVRELENLISSLENSRDSVVFASGMASITAVALTLLRRGSKILLGTPTYGDTYVLFNDLLTRFGIEVENYPAHELHKYSGEADMIFVEAVTNPTLRVPAVDEIEGLIVIDNTFTTPLFYRGLDHAYAVVASLTKFMNGHSDALGGYVASNDESFIERLRYTLFLTGAAIDPMASRLISRGLLTLEHRLKVYDEHAIKLVEALFDLGYVAYYPLHPEHPDYDIARRLLRGFTGIIAVDALEERRAREIVNKLISRGIRLAPSFGSPETLVEIPRSLSHAFMSDKQKLSLGITPGLIRISLGFKNIEEDVEKIVEAFKS